MPLISKTQLPRLSPNVRMSNPAAKRQIKDAASRSIKSGGRYDIFLSHSFLDADDVLLLKEYLESLDLTVFVDWIESPELDRTEVTPETAAYLRSVIDRSSSLLYAISANASKSRWMPWELGYGDGVHGRVAIVPITDQQTASEAYTGQEYLGLYPYVTLTDDNRGVRKLWVNESASTYVNLKSWLNGAVPKYHP
jgi:hypothetical protein